MGLLTDKAKPVIDKLEQYFSDEAATEALALVETSDPNAAKDALLLAAGYIERGVALPGNLAHYLVKAIETAMAEPTQKQRAKALTVALGLTALNKRPVGDWASVGADVELHISKGASEDRALLDVSDQYGISKSTTKRYWKEYQRCSLAFQADVDNKLASQKPPTF